MPKLTTAEFISLYKHNPNNALQWIQENEIELPALFTTLEAIIQLGLVTTLKSRDLFAQKLPQELLRDKYQEIRLPIEAWLNRSAAQVATLFQSYVQYIALINASSLIAGELFKKESSRLAALFVTCTQFMELHHASFSLASDVFRKDPSRIAGLFVTCEQFMELHHASFSLASDVFRKDPNRIAGLFVTCEQFMELHHASSSLASDVLRKDADRIAALFETESQLRQLQSQSTLLANEIAEIRKRMGMTLKVSSLLAPDSREKRATIVSHQTPDNSSDRNIKYDHLIEPIPETNYSFYLKCLAGFAILGGALLGITAIILALPEIAVLGIAVAAVGAIGLYGLFSKPNKKNEADLSDEMLFRI